MQNLHGYAFHFAEGVMVIEASGAQIDSTAMPAFRDSTRQRFAGFGLLPGHRVGLVSTMLARGIGGSVAGSP